jgi:hypothetical protein
MAKVKNPHEVIEKNKDLVYSERTIKKSSGDNFTHNVRSVKLKSRKRKQKSKNI